MPKPLTFEMSADARFLYQRLRACEIGQILTYGELSSVISKPVAGATPSLRTAMKAALRDDSYVFGAIRGVGIKRLNDVEITNQGDAEIASTRRKARRAVRKLTAVRDFNAMPQKTQLRHTALVSTAAIIADVTREAAIAKVEAVSSGRSKELPIAETLRAMGIVT